MYRSGLGHRSRRDGTCCTIVSALIIATSRIVATVQWCNSTEQIALQGRILYGLFCNFVFVYNQWGITYVDKNTPTADPHSQTFDFRPHFHRTGRPLPRSSLSLSHPEQLRRGSKADVCVCVQHDEKCEIW